MTSDLGTIAPSRPPPAGPAPDHRRGGTRGAGWFAVMATLLGGLAPLLLMNSTPLGSESSPAWVLAWAVTVLVGLRYAWLVADGSRRLYEVVFWLFTYVFLGLAPLVQMRSGRYPGTTPDLDVTRNAAAMAVVAVGAAAFAVGAVLGSRLPPPRPDRTGPRVRDLRVWLLTAGALLLAAYYASRVGLGTLTESRSARATAAAAAWPNATVNAVVTALSTLPLVVAFAALMVLQAQRRAARGRFPLLASRVVLAALLLMVNPISSPRYVAGTAVLTAVVALGAVATRRRMRVFSLAVVVGLVFVFPYADIARYGSGTGSEKTGGPAQVLSSPDFDAFDQINNSLVYVEDVRPSPGSQLAGAVLFWVPRSVWPGKPEDTGVVLAEFRGYKVTNLSAPLWAEAYVNGGWLALVCGLLVLGIVVRRADLRMDRVRPRPRSPGVLSAALPFYALLMLRGSLLQSMAGLAVLTACSRFVSPRSVP